MCRERRVRHRHYLTLPGRAALYSSQSIGSSGKGGLIVRTAASRTLGDGIKKVGTQETGDAIVKGLDRLA